MCNLYIITFQRESSGPDFAVVLATNESEAKDLAMKEVLKTWWGGVDGIVYIEKHSNLTSPRCIRVGTQCC